MNVSHSAGFRARLKYTGVCCNVEQFVLTCVLQGAVCYSQGCLLWAGMVLQRLRFCILLENVVAMLVSVVIKDVWNLTLIPRI